MKRAMQLGGVMWFRCLSYGFVAIAAIFGPTNFAKGSIEVYSDGPAASAGGLFINGAESVSDSFVSQLTTPATLTSAQVGLWTYLGDNHQPQSLSWEIGTSVHGNQISSGTASLVNISHTVSGWNKWQSTFTLSGTISPSQTYYLTLFGGVANGGGLIWDMYNYGSVPSMSYRYQNDAPVGTYGGTDFSLYGDPVVNAAVPEPLSFAIWGVLGTIGVAVGLARRRYYRQK